MKRIVLLLCLLSGCAPYEPQPPLVSRIEHNGHDYLKFLDIGGSSFVHDPECRCNTDSK